MSLIPTGTQTFSKSYLQFPVGRSPHFISRGEGARVWDIDGNEYIDLVSGLLSVMLGYRDSDVDKAIMNQLEKGISFSLATELEYELASRLVQMIPCAEQVRFAKNGSDATSAAIRISRAVTGKDEVIVCGYHGWQDWYIGSTTRNKGVPESVQSLTHKIPYNDLDSLQSLLETNKIAALIVEPAQSGYPEKTYLESARDLLHQHGALLIFDEVISGFRFAKGGAQELFAVTPDLACFGKALANGMPLSAIAGSEVFMKEFENIFVSGTYGGESLSLAAAIAVIDKINSYPVIDSLWDAGQKIADYVEQQIKHHELEDIIAISGYAPMKVLHFHEHHNAGSDAIKTLFICEMLDAGIMTIGSHNMMFAHDSEAISKIQLAYDTTLGKISEEIKRPGLRDRLGCELIKPVFSVRG